MKRKKYSRHITDNEFTRLWDEIGLEGITTTTGMRDDWAKERAARLGLRPRQMRHALDYVPPGSRTTIAKRRANDAVRNALKSGRLTRPERCQRCQQTAAIHAHHHRGYADEHRLDVEWLCVLCHRAETPIKDRKLDADAVRLIRAKWLPRATTAALYGINAWTVHQCVALKSYRDVADGSPSLAYIDHVQALLIERDLAAHRRNQPGL